MRRPKLGDERTVNRFWWWPVTVSGRTFWLERASIKQWYERRLIDGYFVTKWFNVGHFELEEFYAIYYSD